MKTFNGFLSHLSRIILLFLLFFIWVKFYEKNLVNCLIYTSILTFICDCLFTLFFQKKDVKANLKRKEILEAEGYSNYFVINGQNSAITFWNNLLSQQFKTIKKQSFVFFETAEEKTALYPHYTIEKLSISDLIKIYNKIQSMECNKIIICTNIIDPSTKLFCENLPCKIILLDKYESYEKLMKKYNYFPEKSIVLNIKPKNTFKTLLAFSLNRKRTKGYLFASLVLIFSSFFVKITVYYLVISSILLLLAIFSFTNTFYNKKIPDEII